MTRLTTSTLTLASTVGVSAVLSGFAALLLTGSGQAQSLPAAKPAQVQASQASTSATPAPVLAVGRDGQRTVRVVYAGAVVAR